MITTEQRPVGRPASQPVRRVRLAGLLSGLLALAAFLGVAELFGAFVGPSSTPAIAIGQTAIDAVPVELKEFAIRTFGDNDKIVLLAGIFATLAVLAALAGLAATWGLAYGLVPVGLLTVVAAVAAVSRPTGRVVDALPSVLGGLAAAGALYLLRVRRSKAGAAPVVPANPAHGPGNSELTRRTLVTYGLVIAGAAAAAGVSGRTFLARSGQALASRMAIVFPAVASKAPAAVGVPQAAVEGAVSFFTPNDDFYRVDTALTVPQIDADTWSLRIHGMVDQPVTLSLSDLLAEPLVERDITLTCVSNEVGGPYVGNARWTGVLLGPLLERLGVQAGATQVLSRSVDGWTCGTPTAALTDGRDAMLAVKMNGEPLPFEHGFPVRMVVPGLYGYVSATKWVTELELTTLDEKAYWITRGYAQQAPIKISSRIDTPKPLSRVPAGTIPIAGVAWAQGTGIAAVEVSIDGGPWQAARLAGEAGIDTWRQWVFPWEAAAGSHRIAVRATDKDGVTQTADRAPIFPDGATGRHELLVTVA